METVRIIQFFLLHMIRTHCLEVTTGAYSAILWQLCIALTPDHVWIIRIKLWTYSYVSNGTSLLPSLVVMTSRLTPNTFPQLSLARRSKISLLYTSTTETSTQQLPGGFSEISLENKIKGKKKKAKKYRSQTQVNDKYLFFNCNLLTIW